MTTVPIADESLVQFSQWGDFCCSTKTSLCYHPGWSAAHTGLFALDMAGDMTGELHAFGHALCACCCVPKFRVTLDLLPQCLFAG